MELVSLVFFLTFCSVVTLFLVGQNISLSVCNRYSNQPWRWLLALLVSLVFISTYQFQENIVDMSANLGPYGLFAAALAIVSFLYDRFSGEQLTISTLVVDRILYGMQKLLAVIAPFAVVLALVPDLAGGFYYYNMITAWIGFGAMYGSAAGLRRDKYSSTNPRS